MFSRKVRKEHDELKEKYDDLESKYDVLHTEHEKLKEEAGERTNVRISYIEEEIESMNARVEKLASDSYAIHSEVRDIHESVLELKTSLSEIVSLYRAILSKYGFGNIKVNPREPSARDVTGRGRRRVEEEPGDDVIEALRREQERKDAAQASRSRSAPPRPQEPRDEPVPRPLTTPSALDELHRISEDRMEDEGAMAERISARSSRDDRVERVARRDMDRRGPVDMRGGGEFTRALPRKQLGRSGPSQGPSQPPPGDWEAMTPPEGPDADHKGDREARGQRRKPNLEDLLSPE